MDQNSLRLFFGLFAVMLPSMAVLATAAYYLVKGIKCVWLKRLGPTIWYLLTGDAKVLPSK